MNREDKEKVADFLNLYNSQYDENVKILEQSIFLIKDLRNAVAHNHIIFDCRFRKTQNVAQNLKATVKNKLHLEAETNFDILFDYLALLMIFLKESGNSRSELNSYITDFENSVNILYKSTEEIAHNKEPLPYSVYNLIIGERFKLKLNKFVNTDLKLSEITGLKMYFFTGLNAALHVVPCNLSYDMICQKF